MGYFKLRAGRRSIVGQIYLVTFHTSRRRNYFAVSAFAMSACRVMTAQQTWPASHLLAWVLMPDHWHGLIELGEESLSLCVARLKALSARELRSANALPGSIWASGYHDRALRESDDVAVAARYLLMNPVRAGLVGRPGDYAFWDAVWLESSRLKPLPKKSSELCWARSSRLKPLPQKHPGISRLG